MDRGADLETRDSRNWTPLIYAAEALNERIAKRLVRKHQTKNRSPDNFIIQDRLWGGPRGEGEVRGAFQNTGIYYY